MANKVSDEMEKQVLELQRQGKTIRKIAHALKVWLNAGQNPFPDGPLHRRRFQETTGRAP